ncbi:MULTISPECIES: three-Cys-motif partner protein TcmP [unclassified Enterococcus]|uniref:three-Cys-motif partner protein TcmP n=1 Tax=unclassified Enterococcus TaxID=2608891 RepID=UPI003F226912
MNKCNNIYDSKECLKQISNLTHVGTAHKISFMRKYIDAWYHAVLNYGYSGVVFIDCMSNCGAYNDKGHAVNGTSQEAMRSFLSQNNDSYSYKAKSFGIYVNDVDPERIICQQCIWKKTVDEFGEKQNVSFCSTNQDVSYFLREEALSILSDAERTNKHILLFYDPYQAKIDWEGLKPFLISGDVDVILTHFTSDVIRGIKNATSNKAKQKYEETYDMPFEEIKRQITDPNVRSLSFLRNRIIDKVSELSKKKLVSYGPIFNSRDVVVYDIVLISKAPKTKRLLKSFLYNEYKKNKQNKNKQLPEEKQVFQLALFSFTDDCADDYDSQRSSGVSEKDYFYSPEQFAKIIYKQFQGKIVSNTAYKAFIEGHSFIPPNANQQIDPILKNVYQVLIKHKSAKKNIKEKYYDFREVGERNE